MTFNTWRTALMTAGAVAAACTLTAACSKGG